jgi:hypothetical protein
MKKTVSNITIWAIQSTKDTLQRASKKSFQTDETKTSVETIKIHHTTQTYTKLVQTTNKK